MNDLLDLIVGEHRVVRSPEYGRLVAFRQHEGFEIAWYVPNNTAYVTAHWRIVLPEKPIPLLFADLYDPVSGNFERCFSQCYPANLTCGRTADKISVLVNACCQAELWRIHSPEPVPSFLPLQITTLWQDGTFWKFTHHSGKMNTIFHGKRMPITSTPKASIMLELREAAGLAPTPGRFLKDGLIDAHEARRDYLRLVAERPERKQIALHILGKCEI